MTAAGTSPPARIAVLASGGGSNLQSLLDHIARDASPAGRVVWVGSNRSDAGALTRARAKGIATGIISLHTDGEALLAMLRAHDIDLVVLAGYLRLLPREVVHAFHGRVLNVHPALLPAFGGAGMYGMRVHEAVIASGALVSGATVHFVDEHYDRGAIVAQWPVPVLQSDTPFSLASRVLQVEHRLLPFAVMAVASGVVSLVADGAATTVRHYSGPRLSSHVPSRFALAYDTDPDPTGHATRTFEQQIASLFTS